MVQKAKEPIADDLQIAYQAHTLVQMLYARLVAAPGWAPIAQASIPSVLH